MNLEYHLSKAREAANAAGKIVLRRCKAGDLGVTYKDDGTPVTDADKEAERKIREVVLGAFPAHGFVGEEFAPVEGTSPFRWYCDPNDGTWCLINGEKTASTSLALSDGKNTVLAVVSNPFTGEIFAGADGIMASLNGERLPRFSRTDPHEAVYNFQISPRRAGDVMKLYELWGQDAFAKLISRGGSIAYNLAQVAEGSHSCYIAASTRQSNPWDIAGGTYLVRSVGGVVSQLDAGKVLVASTNPEIHGKTLELLATVGFGKSQ